MRLPPDVKRTAGEAFDRKDRPIHFLASSPAYASYTQHVHRYQLVAVNELRGDEQLAQLEVVLRRATVLIDSGIFWMTNVHARKHDVSMNEALALPPEEIDGFDELWNRYIEVCREFGDRSWGYIELDQGGRENKIRTRKKLEQQGLRPIPVYHPLNDGWDYFDELAQQYDRICFGNIVQAKASERVRLLATLDRRRREYPWLWVHVLGLTANEMMLAFPADSCDSSTWLAPVKLPTGLTCRSALRTIGRLDNRYNYKLQDTTDPESATGRSKALCMSAFNTRCDQANWRRALDRMVRLKLAPLP